MHYVYLLQSQSHQKRRYVGLTSDLKFRLTKHNEGGVPHTAKFLPGTLRGYTAFQSREQAAEFERYLKVRIRSSLRQPPSLALIGG